MIHMIHDCEPECTKRYVTYLQHQETINTKLAEQVAMTSLINLQLKQEIKHLQAEVKDLKAEFVN